VPESEWQWQWQLSVHVEAWAHRSGRWISVVIGESAIGKPFTFRTAYLLMEERIALVGITHSHFIHSHYIHSHHKTYSQPIAAVQHNNNLALSSTSILLSRHIRALPVAENCFRELRGRLFHHTWRNCQICIAILLPVHHRQDGPDGWMNIGIGWSTYQEVKGEERSSSNH
jgi:hypothetical protein